MKEWWAWFNNPFVKGATGCALSLFLALNFPVVFLAIVATALCYAVVPVAVACAYRKRWHSGQVRTRGPLRAEGLLWLRRRMQSNSGARSGRIRETKAP